MSPNLIAVENKIARVLSTKPECFITHPTELAVLESMSPEEIEEFAIDHGWRVVSRLDRQLKSPRHSIRVGCNCDRGINQNCVRAHLHRFRCLTWRTQSGINHYRHGRLFDDDFDLRPRFNPAIAPNWRTQRHHCRSS